MVTGTVAAGSGFYDPGAGFAKRITAAVTGGVVVNSVNYTDPTHVTLNLNTVGAATGPQDVTITNPDSQARTGTGILLVTGGGTPTPTLTQSGYFETESLPVKAISGAAHTVVSDGKMSGDAGTLLSKSAPGSFVTYNVPVPEAATYRIKLNVKTSPNRGTFQLRIAGVKRGAVQDEYSPTVQYQVRDSGLVTFSGAGNKAFKFTLTGKNPSSNGTSLVFDAISLIRQ